MQKSRGARWLVSGLLGLLLVAAVGAYLVSSLRRSCEVDVVKETSALLGIQLKTFDQVYQVAATASRTTPDHPVNTLKQILMDTQELRVPGCMKTAKTELLDYMGTVILAFQSYRAGEADATVVDLIKQSDAQYANFRTELKAINQCAPLCLR